MYRLFREQVVEKLSQLIIIKNVLLQALSAAARPSSLSPSRSTRTPTSSSTSDAASAATRCPKSCAISRNWRSRSTERPSPSWDERPSSPTPPTCPSQLARPPSTPALPCPSISAIWVTTFPWWQTRLRVGPKPWEKSLVVSPRCRPIPVTRLTWEPAWLPSTSVPAESSVSETRSEKDRSRSSELSLHPVKSLF